MGRDLILYPKQATKQELKQFLEIRGFKKCKHAWTWPEGTLNYSWFEERDYISIDGVSADIYTSKGDKNKRWENEWALHVRNKYSASSFDVKMLNKVLRDARSQFGGTIIGDYGTNRYAEEWDDDSTPISRGVGKVYAEIMEKISSLEHSIPEASLSLDYNNRSSEEIELLDQIAKYDPSRTLYNALVPFAVASMEYFFSKVFEILIKYDERAVVKQKENKQKVNFSVLIDVIDGNETLEKIISSNYSFQNVSQINKAYKEWLDIDIKEILYKKKKIGKSIDFLEVKFDSIIQRRHGIIHRFSFDNTLTKETYFDILKTVKVIIDETITSIEKKYDVQILDSDYT